MSGTKAQFDSSTDPAASIAQAEKEINSPAAVSGKSAQSDSSVDSGVNENVEAKFPGSSVQVGGTKRGENPTIPDEEGGELNKASGRQTKANEFEGEGGPEHKIRQAETDRAGDNDVTGTNR